MADAIISTAERLVAAFQERIPGGGGMEEFVTLSDTLKSMKDVLDDADNRRFKDKSVNDWLSWLENTTHKMDDVLDKWDYVLMDPDQSDEQKENGVYNVAKRIIELKSQLNAILGKKELYSIGLRKPTTSPESTPPQPTPSLDSEEIYGRDSDKDILLNKLTAKHANPQLLAITGMPGIGKTTLAQLVYNEAGVKECFKLRIWVSVQDHSDEDEIAKAIIEAVKKSPSNPMEMLVSNLTDLFGGKKDGDLFSTLANSIKGKKFLLVLDDLREKDCTKWECLKKVLEHSEGGSKILVTTRNEGVVEKMGKIEREIYSLSKLSDEDSWAVMKRAALHGRSDGEDLRFRDVGRRIVEGCDGLPLAAKALGKLLHSKKSFEEWENVSVGQVLEKEIYPSVLTSYNQLPSTVKRCFSFCGVFEKGYEFKVAKLIGFWGALGYLDSDVGWESKGMEYLDILSKHSLLQVFEKDENMGKIKWFQMHDILHDFVRFIRTNSVENPEEVCEVCHPLLVSRVREYRTIFLKHTPLLTLCPCLASTRLLKTSYKWQKIPHGMEKNLIHLRWLNLSGSRFFSEDMRIICKLYNLQTLLLARCELEEIPPGFASLVKLQHLDLTGNLFEEVPDSMCSLVELQTLNLNSCESLKRLPEEIHKLVNLKNLFFERTKLHVFPLEVAKLLRLEKVTEFRIGSDWNKWSLLKNLDNLSGFMKLIVKLRDGDEVEEIEEAEMKKKVDIQQQLIRFEDEDLSMSMWDKVIDVFELPPNLQYLTIFLYKGVKVPMLASNLVQLKRVHFQQFVNLQSLPPLGQLPNLEEVYMNTMEGLTVVGRQFLGMTGDSSSPSSSVVWFPKLKSLTFYNCPNWWKWEDITPEEEESTTVSVMPCLTTLVMIKCAALKELPHRLLGKAESLEDLETIGSKITIHSFPRGTFKNRNFEMKSDRF